MAGGGRTNWREQLLPAFPPYAWVSSREPYPNLEGEEVERRASGVAHSIAHAPDCWILLDVQPKPGFSRKERQGTAARWQGYMSACPFFSGAPFVVKISTALFQGEGGSGSGNLVADTMEKRIPDIPPQFTVGRSGSLKSGGCPTNSQQCAFSRQAATPP